jgi:Phospholipase_D-nuclease N-terminal
VVEARQQRDIAVLRLAPYIIEIGLLIYALIDAIQTPSEEVRNLPKVAWILLILLIPWAGPIAWLVAGRPKGGAGRVVPWPATRTAGYPEYERPRPLGPDDDPDFMREMKRGNDEQEQLLNRWEADLRRREEQTKPPSDGATDNPPHDDGPDSAPPPTA